MYTNRRCFMMCVAATGAALATNLAIAQTKVDEKDPQAVALGYMSDNTKVDVKKYPKHDATQMCGTCALYQGKPGDAGGNCPLFAGKQVNAKGWCSAYAKKA